jgi:hypothetical protein
VAIIIMMMMMIIITTIQQLYNNKNVVCRMLSDGPYDSKILPLTVAITMTIILGAAWIGAIIQYAKG